MSGLPDGALDELRVVVIDDSAYARQTIADLLASEPGIRVVGRAGDGAEGLRVVLAKRPDLVTLDLEMPGMDGFALLRLLMHQLPTPVLVVTGRRDRGDVFRALEAGALDFVVKPSLRATPELHAIRAELVAKVRQVRQLRRGALAERAQRPVRPTPPGSIPALAPEPASGPAVRGPSKLVAIAASTGGPPALQALLAALPPVSGLGAVITQHMPPDFTRAFAERLGRASRWNAREAQTGDPLAAGAALVAPGSGSLALRRDGHAVRVTVEPPLPDARFTPSADRMFETAAAVMREHLLAVILTGMHGDGAAGARAVKAAGGRVIAEARETAVVFGMPEGAIAACAVDEVLPLGRIAEAVARFARR
jgi:two-component system, chemotaxis family, protein-glutamate methylesterase/glutaminase